MSTFQTGPTKTAILRHFDMHMHDWKASLCFLGLRWSLKFNLFTNHIVHTMYHTFLKDLRHPNPINCSALVQIQTWDPFLYLLGLRLSSKIWLAHETRCLLKDLYWCRPIQKHQNSTFSVTTLKMWILRPAVYNSSKGTADWLMLQMKT